MPNRFRDNDRRDFQGDYGYREDDFDDRRFGQRNFNDTANRRSAPSRGFERGENYFGSGQIGYGDGIQDAEPNHSFGSSWRDSTGYSNYDYPERRRYESTERRAGFGRDAFGLGYGGDWEPEANRQRQFRNESFDRNRNDRGFRDQDRYSRNYPDSESGFYGRSSGRGERDWWDRASDEVSSWFGDEQAERRREMDDRRGHRGRGPKNYTRSDERIREDISDRLSDNDYLDASDVEVNVQNSEVTLTGTVNSRREKRLAEDLAEAVSGVSNVENRIRVRRAVQGTGNYGYGDVAGHTESNRTESTASQTETGTTNRSRSASNRT